MGNETTAFFEDDNNTNETIPTIPSITDEDENDGDNNATNDDFSSSSSSSGSTSSGSLLDSIDTFLNDLFGTAGNNDGIESQQQVNGGNSSQEVVNGSEPQPQINRGAEEVNGEGEESQQVINDTTLDVIQAEMSSGQSTSSVTICYSLILLISISFTLAF